MTVADDVAPVTAALAQAVETLREQLGIANRRIDELQAALAEERRRLTAVLMHRQAGSVPAVAAVTRLRQSWWRHWFR
jgi:hypothetical protein